MASAGFVSNNPALAALRPKQLLAGIWQF